MKKSIFSVILTALILTVNSGLFSQGNISVSSISKTYVPHDSLAFLVTYKIGASNYTRLFTWKKIISYALQDSLPQQTLDSLKTVLLRVGTKDVTSFFTKLSTANQALSLALGDTSVIQSKIGRELAKETKDCLYGDDRLNGTTVGKWSGTNDGSIAYGAGIFTVTTGNDTYSGIRIPLTSAAADSYYVWIDLKWISGSGAICILNAFGAGEYFNVTPNGTLTTYTGTIVITTPGSYLAVEKVLNNAGETFQVANVRIFKKDYYFDDFIGKTIAVRPNVIGDSQIINEAMDPFVKRGVIVTGGGLVTWDDATTTLTWDANISIVMPKGGMYVVAPGSVSIPTGGVAYLSTAAGADSWLDEDKDSGSTAAYIRAIAYNLMDRDQKGCVTIGINDGTTYEGFWPGTKRSSIVID